MHPTQAQFAKYACFVCAPKEYNPSGLNLVFEPTAEGIQAQVSLGAKFQSYPGIIHGGILGAVMDEAMAYLGIFQTGKLAFTKKLEIQFRRGVAADTNYLCEAIFLTSKAEGYTARAAIREAGKKSALVTAQAEFVYPSPAMLARMMDKEAAEAMGRRNPPPGD